MSFGDFAGLRLSTAFLLCGFRRSLAASFVIISHLLPFVNTFSKTFFGFFKVFSAPVWTSKLFSGLTLSSLPFTLALLLSASLHCRVIILSLSWKSADTWPRGLPRRVTFLSLSWKSAVTWPQHCCRSESSVSIPHPHLLCQDLFSLFLTLFLLSVFRIVCWLKIPFFTVVLTSYFSTPQRKSLSLPLSFPFFRPLIQQEKIFIQHSW